MVNSRASKMLRDMKEMEENYYKEMTADLIRESEGGW